MGPAEFEDWVEGDWGSEDDDQPSRWRRLTIIGVAVVVALSLALVPLYNVLTGPQIADNGLEVCGFDYCAIQDAMRDRGLDLEMSRLANTILTDEEAALLAAALTRHLDLEPIEFAVVDELQGRIGGFYSASSRQIFVERPANAWIVAHEVAHAASSGHGDEFRDVLAGLATWLGDSDAG